MPSISRSLLVAVHAAAFSAFLAAPFAPVSALASPMPMPLPLSLMTANYRAVNSTFRKPTMRDKDTKRKSTRVKHAAVARNDTASPVVHRTSVVKTLSKTKGRRANSDDAYNKLNGYYNAASTHSKNLRKSCLYFSFYIRR